MPQYLYQLSYTAESLAAQIQNPQDRIEVKSRVVCKSERKLLDASVRLPWRPPSVREA